MISGMEGFGLLVGHLVGDYLLQNDWMAKNKSNAWPGKNPYYNEVFLGCTKSIMKDTDEDIVKKARFWKAGYDLWMLGNLACTLHCLLYTLAIYLFSLSWRPGVSSWTPWWGLLFCFFLHWIIDRFRLARKFMDYTGQRDFATGPLAPWSVIIVDNTWHLLTLYLIALLT